MNLRIKQSDSPCTPDCPNRWAECHAECEAYLKYQTKQHEKYDQHAKELDAYWDGMTSGKSKMIRVNHRARKHSIKA